MNKEVTHKIGRLRKAYEDFDSFKTSGRGIASARPQRENIKSQNNYGFNICRYLKQVDVPVPRSGWRSHLAEQKHTMNVWGKQTPGWRLSAPAVLPVTFLKRLPMLTCHSSSERREKMKADRNRGSIQIMCL